MIDAKRGKLFTKLIKNIEVAARMGGCRPGRQPDAVRRHPEGEEVVGPEQEHRLRGQSAARAWRPAAPTTRRSCTRVTARTVSRCSSSASPTTATAPPPRSASP
ncbi:YebC/PmpR family DNA-binding transcriptional regulator [Streptomyces tricolor]|nr:YebC/PmpR family DNA-binding transcriptional regulator [Streptomyces tricolor]